MDSNICNSSQGHDLSIFLLPNTDTGQFLLLPTVLKIPAKIIILLSLLAHTIYPIQLCVTHLLGGKNKSDKISSLLVSLQGLFIFSRFKCEFFSLALKLLCHLPSKCPFSFIAIVFVPASILRYF